jgi:hypothetical protein
MRFRDTIALDEAEVLAGRYKSVSGRYSGHGADR